jgi:hypothetical protein
MKARQDGDSEVLRSDAQARARIARIGCGVATIAMILAVPTLASAQPQAPPRTPRPYQGLFQGGDSAAPNQLLTFDAELFGGYDESASVDGPIGGPGQSTIAQGPSSGMNLALEYSPTGQRWEFTANAMTALRYFADFNDLLSASHGAGVALVVKLSPRTEVSGRANAAYVPYFDITDPLRVPPPDVDVAPSRLRDDTVTTMAYDASGDLTHNLSRRAVLRFGYGTHITDMQDGVRGDSTDRAFNASLSNHFRQNAYWRLAYNFQDSQYKDPTGSVGTRIHEFTGGFDREWHRTATRSTTLSLRGGPAIYKRLSNNVTTASTTVTLAHQLSQVWVLDLTYRRGVNFIQGVVDPVFAQSASVGLSAALSRRVDFSLSASYTDGEIGVDLPDSSHQRHSGAARMRFALSRTSALYTEYLFYGYMFTQGAPIPSDFPQDRNRSSVRAGIVFFLPLRTQEPRDGAR